MKRSADIDQILRPLKDTPFQAYLSNAVQVADILEWILGQVGVAGMADFFLHIGGISSPLILHH